MVDKDKLLNILKKYWGYSDFRLDQEKIIRTILANQDLLALLPTGGGKSLCYQIPTLYKNKPCLVVSPLIALMQDQVNDLLSRNIPAIYLSGNILYEEFTQFKTAALQMKYLFIFISPERLQSKMFYDFFQKMDWGLFAIDEAHCISLFGQDFRPSYLELKLLKNTFPNTPVLAVTASATNKVQQEIISFLKLQNHTIVQSSFLRPNLSFSCFDVAIKLNKIFDIMKVVKGTGIIYCSTQAACEFVAYQLVQNGFNADYYHAGLNKDSREKKLINWLQDKITTMVCTNAFGMGINKLAVRYVIHYHLPLSLENYYQEAGRAGRDGKKAYAVLLYSNNDVKEITEKKINMFPSPTTMQQYYQKLWDWSQTLNCNEFSLQEYYHLHKKERLAVKETLNQLLLHKVLCCDYNNKEFKLSKIKIIISPQEYLKLLETENNYKLLLQTLPKQYPNIFIAQTHISFQTLSSILNIPNEQLKNQCYQCHQDNIIEFIEGNEEVLYHWQKPFVNAKKWSFDMTTYNQRKSTVEAQIAAMLNYLSLNEDCRVKFILNYFNQKNISLCGKCDLCLAQKNKLQRQYYVDQCLNQLKTIKSEDRTVNNMLNNFTTLEKKYIEDVLKILIENNDIEIDNFGFIKLLNKKLFR